MAATTARALIAGVAGKIEVASAIPEGARALAVIAHPHPLFGGTMDNKVVTTLTKVFVEAGAATYRLNFRGVGASEGGQDEGRGETDDMVQVIAHARERHSGLPLMLAGFSFGGAVAVRASGRVDFERLVLVAPGLRRITGQGMGEPPRPDDPQLGEPGRHGPENTLIIHGDLDETVPLADSLAWATPRDVPVAVVPGGEHFFHRKLHVLRAILSRWLR